MISIIIPTLNEEKVIGDTLRRLRTGLRRTRYEIIVSDGGSTDLTVEIARPLADHVVVHEGTKRQTIGEGRNAGAAAARGDFFVFMDADVAIPAPDAFFKKVLAAFEKDHDLLGIAPYVLVFPKEATIPDRIIFGYLNRFYYFVNRFLAIGMAAGEFQCVRADVFRRIGGYRPHLVAGEDHEFFSRITGFGKTRILSSLSVFHTGRRAHKIGWPKLLVQWGANAISVIFRKRAASKEWKPIR